jgi:hypothetical protein
MGRGATAGPGAATAGRKTLSLALVVLSLVAYGLVVGTVGGVVTARLTGYPGSPVVAPAADVPRASDGLFKGVTSLGLEGVLTRAGYSCDAAGPSTTPAPPALCTDGRTAGYDISVTVGSGDKGTVTSLTGRCRPTSNTATLDGCGAFIANVPGLLYPANASRARAAQDWAAQNMGADTSTVIDGVYYLMQLEPLLIVCMPAA